MITCQLSLSVWGSLRPFCECGCLILTAPQLWKEQSGGDTVSYRQMSPRD